MLTSRSPSPTGCRLSLTLVTQPLCRNTRLRTNYTLFGTGSDRLETVLGAFQRRDSKEPFADGVRCDSNLVQSQSFKRIAIQHRALEILSVLSARKMTGTRAFEQDARSRLPRSTGTLGVKSARAIEWPLSSEYARVPFENHATLCTAVLLSIRCLQTPSCPGDQFKSRSNHGASPPSRR